MQPYNTHTSIAASMNRANVDGGAVPMDTTTTSLVGAKNTMGQTKQWQTLESIAL